MPRIAILGAGAIGLTLGSRLAESHPDEVHVCVRHPFNKLVVDTPERRIEVVPQIWTAPEEALPAAWVLLATKAQDTRSTQPWLERLIAEDTRVAVLQNGVEHRERLAGLVDPARILPVVVDCPSERLEPGYARQRSTALLTVEAGKAGRDFLDLFRGTDIEVRPVADLKSAAWRKLALNVAGGAITAITNQGQGVIRRPGMAELARDLVRECLAVGRAEGASLEDTLVDEVLQSLFDAPPEAGTSVLNDRRAGRVLEVDARNGAVVRLGQKHGITTPKNRCCAVLLASLRHS